MIANEINLLDYTSCVVPVTFADKAIDKKDTNYKPISDLDKLVWEKCISNLLTVLIIDDPEVYHHGPVAVQIVGRRLREEQILEMADTLSNALHKS
jgi:amidase